MNWQARLPPSRAEGTSSWVGWKHCCQPLLRYANLVFSRPGFRNSLSEMEQEMRVA